MTQLRTSFKEKKLWLLHSMMLPRKNIKSLSELIIFCFEFLTFKLLLVLIFKIVHLRLKQEDDG